MKPSPQSSRLRARARGVAAVLSRRPSKELIRARKAIERLPRSWYQQNRLLDPRITVAAKYALDLAGIGHEKKKDLILRKEVQNFCQTTFAHEFLRNRNSTDGRKFAIGIMRMLKLPAAEINDFLFAFKEASKRLAKPHKK